MLADFAITTISNALNRYLRADENSQARLAKLKGKNIVITLKPSKTPFYLHFHADGVSLQTTQTIEPTTSIVGTPLRLLAMSLNPRERKSFFAGDVELSGDAEFAQSVIELFDRVEWDAEEQASRWLGDIGAHKLGNALFELNSHWQAARANLHAQVSEYLQEEATWLPERTQFSAFLNGVDEVKMATDRLEAKINHLIVSKKDAE